VAGLAALAGAYVLSQFYRVFLAVLAPALTVELGVGPVELGRASGAWFVAFALMQLPVGVLLDRYGPRRTAGWLLGIGAGGGAALFAAATGPWSLIAAMALIGAGCAPVLMAALTIFARRFDLRRFATLGSAMVGVGALGNVAAAAPLALAAEAVGWRAALFALGALTVAVAIALLLLVEDPERAPAAGAGGFRDYLALLRPRFLWPIYLMMTVNYAPAVGVRGLWAGPFLRDVHGLDAAGIGAATLWMAIAMAAGSFAFGPLDRLLGTRKWIVAGGSAAVAAGCAALALAPGAGLGAVTALLVAIGFCGMTYGVMMAHARPFFPDGMTGRGTSLMNFFCMTGVGLMQAASGAIVAAGETPAGAYAAVFAFYAVTLAAATIPYLFARDSRP
jgi:MFS family permease